jgi:hypothetical protein
MPATGRLVRAADGTAGDVGKTGVGSVMAGAAAPAVLPAAGAAVPVPEAGGSGVLGAVAPEAGVAAGGAVTEDREVPDAALVAAPADWAAALVAAGPGAVAVAAGCAWPPEGAVG